MPVRIPVRVRTVRLWLWAAVAAVTLLSVPAPLFRYVLGHDYVLGFVPFAEAAFGLNTEGNLPTWVATALLLIASLLLLLVGRAARAAGGEWASHWLGLAAIFAYLSADEAAEIHEQANRLQGVLGAGGILYFTWVVVAAAGLVVLAVVYWRFLFSLPAATRRGFLLAAFLYVGGALGLELAQGYWADAMGSAVYEWGGMVLLTHVEEVMEMSGVVVLIGALMDHLRTTYGSLRLDPVPDGSAVAEPGQRAAQRPARSRPRAAPAPERSRRG